MKKVLFITIVIIVILVCAVIVWFIQSITPSTFVKHFDGSDSALYLDCTQDRDCKIQQLELGCGYYASINKNNAPQDVNAFNAKETELIKGIVFDCQAITPIRDIRPICVKRICTIQDQNN